MLFPMHLTEAPIMVLHLHGLPESLYPVHPTTSRIKVRRNLGVTFLEIDQQGRQTSICFSPAWPMGTHQYLWPVAWWNAGSPLGSGGSHHNRSALWLWQWSPANCQPCCPTREVHLLKGKEGFREIQNLPGKVTSREFLTPSKCYIP